MEEYYSYTPEFYEEGLYSDEEGLYSDEESVMGIDSMEYANDVDSVEYPLYGYLDEEENDFFDFDIVDEEEEEEEVCYNEEFLVKRMEIVENILKARLPLLPIEKPGPPKDPKVLIKRLKSNSREFCEVFPVELSKKPHKYEIKIECNESDIGTIETSNPLLVLDFKKKMTNLCHEGLYEHFYKIQFTSAINAKVTRFNNDTTIIIKGINGNTIWESHVIRIFARRRKSEKLFWNQVDPAAKYETERKAESRKSGKRKRKDESQSSNTRPTKRRKLLTENIDLLVL